MVKRIFDSIHMVIHLFMGIILAHVANQIHPEVTMLYFLLPALIGSFLPDLDHILYFYTYGRKNPYSKKVKKFLKSGDIFDAIQYCATHHKKLTGLYSHNILSMGFILIIGLSMMFLNYWWWSVMMFAITGHFLFDMLEDILLLGRLNKNWIGAFPHN